MAKQPSQTRRQRRAVPSLTPEQRSEVLVSFLSDIILLNQTVADTSLPAEQRAQAKAVLDERMAELLSLGASLDPMLEKQRVRMLDAYEQRQAQFDADRARIATPGQARPDTNGAGDPPEIAEVDAPN